MERAGRIDIQNDKKQQGNDLSNRKIENLEVGPGSVLLQSDLLLLDGKGILRNPTPTQLVSKSISSSTSTSMEPIGEDGELSGAQIDGNLAAQKMLEKESSLIIAFLTQVFKYVLLTITFGTKDGCNLSIYELL